MIVHVAVYCLLEVTYLSAKTDHGENAIFCHVGSKYLVEDLNGSVVDVILRRNSSQVGDSKGTTVLRVINHASLNEASCCGNNQLVSLAVQRRIISYDIIG